MAEIKSTLELVMERTRNLTMSESDRRDHAAAELRAGVNRLIGKYLRSELDVDRFQKELDRIEKEFPGSSAKAAAAEIAKRIDPAEDNGPLLELLRDGCGKDVTGMESLLKKYGERDDLFAAEAAGKILGGLLELGISGSAVIPNTASGKDLTNMRQQMLQEFRKDMEAEIDRLG